MKRFFKLLGFMTLIMVIGFSVAACKDDDGRSTTQAPTSQQSTPPDPWAGYTDPSVPLVANSAEELHEKLRMYKPATTDNPIHITLNVSTLECDFLDNRNYRLTSIGLIISMNSALHLETGTYLRYFNIDLSGSTITEISGFSSLSSRPGWLVGITLPNSVINIRGNTFENQTNLTNIIIPSNVTSIGDYAFGGSDAYPNDTGLTSVTFQSGSVTLPTGHARAFLGDLDEKYKTGGAGTYTRSSTSSTTWTKQ